MSILRRNGTRTSHQRLEVGGREKDDKDSLVVEKEGSQRLYIYTKGVLKYQVATEPNQTVLHHHIPPPLRTLSLNVLYYRKIVKQKYSKRKVYYRKPLPLNKIFIKYLLNKYTYQLYQLLILYLLISLIKSINTPTSRTNCICTTPTSSTS